MSKKNSAPVSTQPAAGEVAVLETQAVATSQPAAVATTDTGVSTEGVTVTPVVAPKAPAKAEISRGIMTSLFAANEALPEADRKSGADVYEATIAAMMLANGYDRQLARGTYKANYLKAKVPAPVVTPKAPKAPVAAAATTTEVAVAASTEVKADEAAPAADKVEDSAQA